MYKAPVAILAKNALFSGLTVSIGDESNFTKILINLFQQLIWLQNFFILHMLLPHFLFALVQRKRLRFLSYIESCIYVTRVKLRRKQISGFLR